MLRGRLLKTGFGSEQRMGSEVVWEMGEGE